jgi:hypothetical protein
MSTHSPEAWHVTGDSVFAHDADGFPVRLFERADATEADMRLAAAAPRLRDALRDILRKGITLGQLMEFQDNALALLAELDKPT